MNNILSLSKARKTKAKDKKEQKASENRIKFGLSKHQKKLQDAKRKKQISDLSAHKKDD